MSDVDHRDTPDNPLLEWALKYAERGIAVFSVGAKTKKPNISREEWSDYLGRPVLKGQAGLHMASTDPDNLRWQFNRPSSGGIAMPCGRVNNVIVADFDIHKEPGKDGNAHRQMAAWQEEIAETHQVVTRNGGLHAYFAYAAGHGKHELGENIEVQTDGSYVLLPPSFGYKVHWMVDREDWEVPPWAALSSRAEASRKASRKDLEGMDSEALLALQRGLADGNWHNSVRDMVAHMVMTGWEDYEIFGMARRWTLRGYNVEQTIDEIYEYVASARTKWGKASNFISKEDRMKRWMEDFENFDADTKQEAVEWGSKRLSE